MSGYPDFQRGQQATANAIVAINQVIAVGNVVNSAIINMSAWQYLNIIAIAQASTNYYRVYTSWYKDQAGTVFLGGQSFTIGPASSNPIQVPALSPWVKITVLNVNDASGSTINVTVYPTNGSTDKLGRAFLSSGILIFSDAIVNAGTSLPIEAAMTAPGYASIDFVMGFTKWTADLKYYDTSLLAFRTLTTYNKTQTTQEIHASMILPSSPVQLTLNNLDTVNHNMYAAINY